MAKPKILLVDADLKSRQMLEISLKKAGFSVTISEEAEKALQMLDNYYPDLIISDIDLAGSMDGFLFCKVLKEQVSSDRIPFIFLTTRKEVEDKIRGLELGVNDYLTKPIYLKEVIARARIIIDKKKQENLDVTGTEPLFQGDLSQMSIVDLLQTMEFSQKTGILHLEKTGHSAKIYNKQGRVVHAVCDNLVGERAVYRTLLWSDGQFQIDFKKSLQTQETIQVSTQALIMEGMRRIDELERIKEQLPPFECQLTIDSETILEEHPDRFPAKIENILAEFNGEQTLEQVVDSLPYDDLESLEIISKLYFQGYLIESDLPKPAIQLDTAPSPAPEGKSTISPGGATLDTQLLNLEEASKSIEEIKAKARLALDQQAPSQSELEPEPEVAQTIEIGSEIGSENVPEPVIEEPAFDMAPPPVQTQVPAETKAPVFAEIEEQVPEPEPVASKSPEKEEEIAVVQIEQPKPVKKKKTKPVEDKPAEPKPVARVIPVTMTSEAPKQDFEPAVEDLPVPHQEPDRIAAQAPAAEPTPPVPENPEVQPPPEPSQQIQPPGSQGLPAVDQYGRPLQVQQPSPQQPQQHPYMQQPVQGYQGHPNQQYGQIPVQHQPFQQLPGMPVPPVPGSSTLTHFGDSTMMQLGDATYLAQGQKTASKKLIYAGIGMVTLVLLLVIALLVRQPEGPDATADEDLYSIAEHAFQMVNDGQWASARRLANDVLKKDPDIPLALYARGKSREQLGRLPDALDDYRRALELNPSLHIARYESVNVGLVQDESSARLRAEIDPVLKKLNPNEDPELYRKSIVLALKLDISSRNWDQARRTLKDAKAIAPNDAQITMLEGQIPAEAKPVPAVKAKPAPQKAKTSKPKPKPKPKMQAKASKRTSTKDEANKLHEKGVSFYNKGYLRNAKRTLEEATKVDPRNDEIWVDLGQVYIELGEDREAMQTFTTAGKIAPHNPRVWENLGSLYMYQGDMDRAKKSFETFLELVPASSSQAKEIKKILENL